MASEIDDLSIEWQDENGTLVRKQIEKKVLTRGSWTTIMYLYQELDRKTNEFMAPKVSIRRYQKRSGNFREQSKFTISSAKQAAQIIEVLNEWYKNPKVSAGGSDEDDNE